MIAVTRPALSRRLLIGVVAFFFLISLLYSQHGDKATRLSWGRVSSYLGASSTQQSTLSGAPVLQPSDHWNPPIDKYDPDTYDWDEYVWLMFNRADEQFALGNKKLTTTVADPQPVHWKQFQKSDTDQEDARDAGSSDPVTCRGPRGDLLDGTNARDGVYQNQGELTGFGGPLLGSNEAIGFQKDVCYDRRGRSGAYGLKVPDQKDDVDWESVDWGDLQEQCYEANKGRFDPSSKATLARAPTKWMNEQRAGKPEPVSRTAVLFRLYSQSVFTPEVRRNMRAVIQELSLQTGGEYQAFALVEVKDPNIPLDSDEQHREAIEKLVPYEFRNMTMLWNQWRWLHEYPLIEAGQLGVHLSQWLPVQWFQRGHPEFDFFWNWEMDIRFTGHNYEMVRKLDDWSAAQPRKGLWERNSRFWIPRIHGTWTRFRDLVQQRYHADDGQDSSIWRPQLETFQATSDQTEWLHKLQNVVPPVPNPSQDNYTWGVGEKADYVAFLPQFQPGPTNYIYEDGFWRYPGFEEEHKHDSTLPRRVSIVTFSRVSARLLHLMELENTVEPGHHMTSEQWPETVALHYGLKSVSVPHGIVMEHEWPIQALDWVFNNGDQQMILKGEGQSYLDQRGEGSGGPESTFGVGREHNWIGASWYFSNGLANKLYKRWLGLAIEDIGGPDWEEENGLYCLPPMMIHPVKVTEGPDDLGTIWPPPEEEEEEEEEDVA